MSSSCPGCLTKSHFKECRHCATLSGNLRSACTARVLTSMKVHGPVTLAPTNHQYRLLSPNGLHRRAFRMHGHHAERRRPLPRVSEVPADRNGWIRFESAWHVGAELVIRAIDIRSSHMRRRPIGRSENAAGNVFPRGTLNERPYKATGQRNRAAARNRCTSGPTRHLVLSRTPARQRSLRQACLAR